MPANATKSFSGTERHAVSTRDCTHKKTKKKSQAYPHLIGVITILVSLKEGRKTRLDRIVVKVSLYSGVVKNNPTKSLR